MVVVDERVGEIFRFLFYFSRNFSGLGSISNMARAEFDKVRGRIRPSGRKLPTLSDHVRRRIRWWWWRRRLRLWWYKVCLQVVRWLATTLSSMLALQRMPLFVTHKFHHVHRIDCLRKKDDAYDLLAENNQDGEQPALDEERDANQQNETDGYVGGDQEMTDGQTTAAPTQQQGERQPNKVRITTRYLTKYERARVLGTRALQIRQVVFDAI